MKNSGWIPTRGDVVTYVFERYSPEGRPWHAIIVKVRQDLVWNDDIHNSDLSTPSMNAYLISDEKTK